MKLLSRLLPLLMTIMIGVTYAYDEQLPKLRGAVTAQEQYLDYGNDDSIYGYPPSCRSDADCHGGDYCCPFHGDYSFCRAGCNRSTDLTSALSESDVRYEDAFDYSDGDDKMPSKDFDMEYDEYQFLGGASCRRDSNCKSGEVCLKRADRSGYKSSVCFDNSKCRPAGYEGKKRQCCSGFAGGNLQTTFCCADKRCRDIK